MTPTPDSVPLLAAVLAPLEAVRPILWFAGIVFAGAMWYNALDRRLAGVEDGIETLTSIVCSDVSRSSDSHCKRAGR